MHAKWYNVNVLALQSVRCSAFRLFVPLCRIFFVVHCAHLFVRFMVLRR
jgi:hypothetical protein